VRRLLREYGLEFVALVVAATGIFLVANEFSIREVLGFVYQNAISHLGSWAVNLSTGVQNYFSRFTSNDLLGWLLFFFGLVFIFWRGRIHFLRSAYWKSVNCPKCGTTLHRIHRTSWDRFLSRVLFLDARRYCCRNPDCGWSGLRRYRDEDRRRHRRHDPTGQLD
jgi:hypothetical protein